MQQTHELGAVYGGDRRRVTFLATGFAAAIGFGLGGILLLAQPALSETARSMLGQRMGSSVAFWAAPVTLVGLATGIAGVGVFLLAGFVRGARRQPFLLLAPLLCGLSTAALGKLPLELSLGGLGSINFALPALLLALGGAAVFQLSGKVAKIAGGLIWLLPAVLLLCGAASVQGTWSATPLLSPVGHPLVALLLFSWLALGVMACIAPDARNTIPLSVARRKVTSLRRQLSEAEERARVATAHPGKTNQAAMMSARKTIATLQSQLVDAEHRTLQATELQERLRVSQARVRRLESTAILGRSRFKAYMWLFLLIVMSMAVTAGAGYVVYMMPLQERLAMNGGIGSATTLAGLQQQLSTQQADSTKALQALRAELKTAQDAIAAKDLALAAAANHKGGKPGSKERGEQAKPAAAAMNPAQAPTPQAQQPGVTPQRPAPPVKAPPISAPAVNNTPPPSTPAAASENRRSAPSALDEFMRPQGQPSAREAAPGPSQPPRTQPSAPTRRQKPAGNDGLGGPVSDDPLEGL